MSGMFLNGYPYTDFHELNLSWLLQQFSVLKKEIDDFVSINALKYADPIQWNITTQYEKNTIVIEPNTGTAFISVQPVPAGVSIYNTSYWTEVFSLDRFITAANNNFTVNIDNQTTTATMALGVGDWVIWEYVLYEVTSPITAGDQYTIGGNIKRITVEQYLGLLVNLTTDNKDSIVDAINSIVDNIGGLDNLTTADKTSLVAAINELLGIIGDISTLTTADTSNLVAAINEVNALAINTADKLNVVSVADKNNTLDLCYVKTLLSKDARYPDFIGQQFYGVVQSMCIDDDNHIVIVRWDEGLSTNDGLVEKYDLEGNKIGSTLTVQVGHGNTITYANGYYYVGWSLAISGGVEVNSNNITKIKKDFSTTQIITADRRVPALSYDDVNDVFYVFAGGTLYTYDSDTFSAPVAALAFNEYFYDTTKYLAQERQNGLYYNGYWIQLYLYPAIQVWYDITTGQVKKVYNYPRRLNYNGFNVYEPEAVAFSPSDGFFYGTSIARCGAGDIISNTLYKFNPDIGAPTGDDKYFLRNGQIINLYVDPTTNDLSYQNGREEYPFKYIQNALDFAQIFDQSCIRVLVKTSNNYLGGIRVSNTNNWTVITASGYSRDSIQTIPEVDAYWCNDISIFQMNAGKFNIQYCSGAQLSSNDCAGETYIFRCDADLYDITTDTLTLRNTSIGLVDVTYTTKSATGYIFYKQSNVAWMDGGYIPSSTVGNIPAGGYLDLQVSYTYPFSEVPNVVLTQVVGSAAVNASRMVNLAATIVNRQKTDFTIRFFNNNASDITVNVSWIAFAEM